MCESCHPICSVRSEERASRTQTTKSCFPPLSPDLKPRKKWDVQWTCPRQPEAGTKFGAKRIQGPWSLSALGGGLRDSKRSLGTQHFMGTPHTPPLLPTLNRGWKGGKRKRYLEGATASPPPTPTPTASDPGLSPPSEQCGFRPDECRPSRQAALGLVERALGPICWLHMPASACCEHPWELTKSRPWRRSLCAQYFL